MLLGLPTCVSLAWLIAVGQAALDFINPSPAGENKDYSADPVFTLGATVTIKWSGSQTGVPLTLAMLQQTIFGEANATQDVIIGINACIGQLVLWFMLT